MAKEELTDLSGDPFFPKVRGMHIPNKKFSNSNALEQQLAGVPVHTLAHCAVSFSAVEVVQDVLLR